MLWARRQCGCALRPGPGPARSARRDHVLRGQPARRPPILLRSRRII